MSEAMDERERYIGNPLRLLRCAVELGRGAIADAMRYVDDALDIEFERVEIGEVEAPALSEEDLLQMRLF